MDDMSSAAHVQDSAINASSQPTTARRDDAAQISTMRTARLADTSPIERTTFLQGTGRFINDQPPPTHQTPSDAGGDPVTLNLVNVPAPQAAKTILGDILGVRYTIDPGIEGKITVQTPEPVSRSAAIELFQSALRSSGAAIINVNGIYKIVAADQATVGAIVRATPLADGESQVGSMVQVVQLKYVSPSEIRRILEPIAPRGTIVRVDDARHAITLAGTREDIANMRDTISLFDVDVMKGMSFAIVPVRISDPATIADELTTVFASDREGPMAGMVQFLPNKRLGAILVMSAQPKYLERAESWVRKLDAQAAGSEKQFFTYLVQNRRAQELVDVLQTMFSNETNGGRTANTPRNVAPDYRESTLQSAGAQSAPSSSSGAFGSGSPMTSGIGSGVGSGMGSGIGSGSTLASFGSSGQRFAAADTSASQTASNSGAGARASATPANGDAPEPRIKLAADDAKNAILIEANRADYRRLMRVIDTLDVMTDQVLIEATIAEVTLNDELKFGLRWFFQRGSSSTFTFSDDPSGATSSVFPGFSYAMTAANVAATLSALNQITDVNVISSPSLTVMDNKTAYLQIGDEVPITTQSAVSVLTTGAPVVNSVSYKDTGVILSITPRINESGRVMLDIEQEVSTVASTTSSTIDSPTIHQRRIKTSVMVNNGEDLALGGMIQDSRTVNHTQIPILGDIPLIGNAFKVKDNQMNKTELIIIITPHVMRNLNEARQVTDEFRRQLSTYSPRDFHMPQPLEQTLRRTFE
jgi:general secretion pathway protein D